MSCGRHIHLLPKRTGKSTEAVLLGYITQLRCESSTLALGHCENLAEFLCDRRRILSISKTKTLTCQSLKVLTCRKDEAATGSSLKYRLVVGTTRGEIHKYLVLAENSRSLCMRDDFEEFHLPFECKL